MIGVLLKQPKALVCAFSVLICTAAMPFFLSHHSGSRTLRVGADNAPPYHTVQQDGSVQGLAVDILNEAARLKHIRLVWIPITKFSTAQALEQKMVDVWPALSRTPEREKTLYFSKPWLESNYCLLSRKNTRLTKQDLAGVNLGVANAPRVIGLVGALFRTSYRVVLPDNTSVVQAVCKGDIAAGFLDARTLDSVLLDRPDGCGSVGLRILFVPEASNPVGMAGQPEVAALIDELREGITPLVTNGVFSAALDRWLGFSGAQTRSYFEIREAQLRARTYLYIAILLAAVGALLIWQITKRRAAERRAERALKAAADSDSRFQAFMDHSPLVSFVKDAGGRMLYANRRFEEVFEKSLDQCIGRDDFEIWPSEIATKIRNDDLLVLQESKSTEVMDHVPAGSGEMCTWLCMKFPFVMAGQQFLGGVALDITEREKAKEAIRISEERFRSAFAHASIGMAVADTRGVFVEVNPGFCSMTGYSGEELIGTGLLALIHPDERNTVLVTDRDAWANTVQSYCVETRWMRKDACTIWVRASVGLVNGSNGQPLHHILLVEDVTIEKQTEEVAVLSEQRWQLALQGTSDGIWDWNAKDNTVFLSPRWKTMLGFDDHELESDPAIWTTLVHPQDLGDALAAVNAHLEKRTSQYTAEYRMRCKDGDYRWILARGKGIWDATGKPTRLIGTHTDIHERKQAEERLLYEANHDPLTGLLNRRCFLSKLETEFDLAKASGDPLCLCICDIDRFKGINDREGHQAGDEVLKLFAGILRDGTRKQDVVGRIGGDEFFMLLPRTASIDAVSCVERIRSRIETVAFTGKSGSVFSVTASFGLALVESTQSYCKDLIAMADQALYKAKEQGRNTSVAY